MLLSLLMYVQLFMFFFVGVRRFAYVIKIISFFLNIKGSNFGKKITLNNCLLEVWES